MALIDNLLKPSTQRSQGLTQADVTKLYQAKSGKATSDSSTPQATNIGEQVVRQQEQGALRDIAQQGKLQGELMTAQEEQQKKEAQLARDQMLQQKNTIDKALNQQVDDLLTKTAQSNEELEFRKDSADLEQAAFAIRLQNDKYTQELQLAGAERRLNQENSFREESIRLLFAEDLIDKKSAMEFGSLFNASEREFSRRLGQLDLNTALSLAKTEARTAAATQIFTGVLGAGKAGLKYAVGKEAEKEQEMQEQYETVGQI